MLEYYIALKSVNVYNIYFIIHVLTCINLKKIIVNNKSKTKNFVYRVQNWQN